jgi:hypothetical protein
VYDETVPPFTDAAILSVWLSLAKSGESTHGIAKVFV